MEKEKCRMCDTIIPEGIYCCPSCHYVSAKVKPIPMWVIWVGCTIVVGIMIYGNMMGYISDEFFEFKGNVGTNMP